MRLQHVNFFGGWGDIFQSITWVIGINHWKVCASLSFYFNFPFLFLLKVLSLLGKQVHFFLKHLTGVPLHSIHWNSVCINVDLLLFFLWFQRPPFFVPSKTWSFHHVLSDTDTSRLLEKLQTRNRNLTQGNCWKVCVLRKVMLSKIHKAIYSLHFSWKSMLIQIMITNDLPHQMMETNS